MHVRNIEYICKMEVETCIINSVQMQMIIHTRGFAKCRIKHVLADYMSLKMNKMKMRGKVRLT